MDLKETDTSPEVPFFVRPRRCSVSERYLQAWQDLNVKGVGFPFGQIVTPRATVECNGLSHINQLSFNIGEMRTMVPQK